MILAGVCVKGYAKKLSNILYKRYNIKMNIFSKWLHSRRAATAMEYGLIAAGISLAIVATVFVAGDNIAAIFETITGYISENL